MLSVVGIYRLKRFAVISIILVCFTGIFCFSPLTVRADPIVIVDQSSQEPVSSAGVILNVHKKKWFHGTDWSQDFYLKSGTDGSVSITEDDFIKNRKKASYCFMRVFKVGYWPRVLYCTKGTSFFGVGSVSIASLPNPIELTKATFNDMTSFRYLTEMRRASFDYEKIVGGLPELGKFVDQFKTEKVSWLSAAITESNSSKIIAILGGVDRNFNDSKFVELIIPLFIDREFNVRLAAVKSYKIIDTTRMPVSLNGPAISNLLNALEETNNAVMKREIFKTLEEKSFICDNLQHVYAKSKELGDRELCLKVGSVLENQYKNDYHELKYESLHAYFQLVTNSGTKYNRVFDEEGLKKFIQTELSRKNLDSKLTILFLRFYSEIHRSQNGHIDFIRSSGDEQFIKIMGEFSRHRNPEVRKSVPGILGFIPIYKKKPYHEMMDILFHLLSDDDSLVSGSAAWAISRQAIQEYETRIKLKLKNTKETQTRQLLQESLKKLDHNSKTTNLHD